MKKSTKFDIFSYVVVLIFCATAYHITLGFTGIQISRTGADPIGAKGFPQLLIGLMAALAIAGIVKAVLVKGGEDKLKVTLKDFETLLKFVVAFFAYVYAIRNVGYGVSTALYAMFNMWWMGVRKPGVIVVTGVVLSAVLYVAFGLFLRTNLPSGFLI